MDTNNYKSKLNNFDIHLYNVICLYSDKGISRSKLARMFNTTQDRIEMGLNKLDYHNYLTTEDKGVIFSYSKQDDLLNDEIRRCIPNKQIMKNLINIRDNDYLSLLLGWD